MWGSRPFSVNSALCSSGNWWKGTPGKAWWAVWCCMFHAIQRMTALVRVERVFSRMFGSWARPRCSMVFCNWWTTLVTIIGASQRITAAHVWKTTDSTAMAM